MLSDSDAPVTRQRKRIRAQKDDEHEGGNEEIDEYDHVGKVDDEEDDEDENENENENEDENENENQEGNAPKPKKADRKKRSKAPNSAWSTEEDNKLVRTEESLANGMLIAGNFRLILCWQLYPSRTTTAMPKSLTSEMARQ